MKKIVMKLEVHDEKSKQKAMRAVSSVPGVDSISMDMKEKTMTVTGNVDLVEMVSKLRRQLQTDIVTVGPAKEEKKESGAGGAGKKEAKEKKKKKEESDPAALNNSSHEHNAYLPKFYHYHHYYPHEDQFSGCVIC